MTEILESNKSFVVLFNVKTQEDINPSVVSSRDPLPYDPMLGWYTAATLSGLLMLFIICVALEKIKDRLLTIFERTSREEQFTKFEESERVNKDQPLNSQCSSRYQILGRDRDQLIFPTFSSIPRGDFKVKSDEEVLHENSQSLEERNKQSSELLNADNLTECKTSDKPARSSPPHI